jgi:hypothetical protein
MKSNLRIWLTIVTIALALPLIAHAQWNETCAIGTVTAVPANFNCPALYPGSQWETSTLTGGGTQTSGPFTATASTVVNPDQDFQVSVVFNPTAPGTYSAGFNFTYNSNLTLQVQLSGTYQTPPVAGYVNPKYLIMGVTYAPPGGNAQSFASYSNSTFVGNTSNNSSSFSQNYTESVSLSEGTCQNQAGDLAGFSAGVCVTGSQSNAWTLTSNSSKAVTISKQTALTLKTPGIPNVYSPVDHDYDIIWLWLNPVVLLTIVQNNSGCTVQTPCPIGWNGYGYDYNDPLHELDIWPIYVGYLNGDFGCYATDPTCDAQDADALARSWVTTQTFASGQGPGITKADFPAILGADPFAGNPGYLVNLEEGTSPLTTTDGRYTQAGVNGVAPQTIPYKQAPPDSTTGENEMYQNTYTQTSTLGEGGSYMYQMGYGLEEKFGDSFFGLGVVYDFKQNWNFTWMNTWQNTITNTTTQVETLSITGPPCPALSAPCDPEYTEPHEFAVYEDNLYGTFMFWPNPYFSLGTVSPATQTVKQGSTATYTIPTAANAGYTGNIASFSVTGVPSGATASFSPTAGAAGTTFTLSVVTSLSTAAGTYPLTISATDGSQSFYAYSTLVVSNGPDFSMAATPSSRTVTVGAKTTYTVSTTALNGFAGVVSLRATGVPSGATAAFSPTTITGSGSSTLTVTTTDTLAAGTYTLTVTGTSGTLTHTATVTLVAQVPDFSISASPSSQTVSAGASTTFTVTTKALRGFSGVESLAVSSLPTDASGTFNPTSITGAGTSTLTIKTTSAIKSGTYSLTITGTSGSLTHTATVKLVVSGPNFTLSITPESEGIAAGSEAIYSVSTTELGGFTGSIALKISGLPSKGTATFNPTSISGAGSSTLTLTTSTSTPTGNYTLTITGTSGTLTHTVTTVLTVNAP